MMENALLARGFVLLVAQLVDQGTLGDDPVSQEIRAIARTYREGSRAQVNYHNTPRGKAALERAEADDTPLQPEIANAQR